MSIRDIIGAWKDQDYRQSLTQTQRDQLPEHPAGLIELTDAELVGAAGGLAPNERSGPVSTYSTWNSLGWRLHHAIQGLRPIFRNDTAVGRYTSRSLHR